MPDQDCSRHALRMQLTVDTLPVGFVDAACSIGQTDEEVEHQASAHELGAQIPPKMAPPRLSFRSR